MEPINPDFAPDVTMNPEPAPISAPAEAVTPVKAKKEKKAKVPKEPKPPKVPVIRLEHDKKNGVIKPGPETSTGKIWAICKELGDATGEIPKRAAVIEKAMLLGLNAGTASTQFGRFCKYWGISNPRPTAFKKKEAPEGQEAPLKAEATGKRGSKSGKQGLTAAAGAAALGEIKVETPSEDTAA